VYPSEFNRFSVPTRTDASSSITAITNSLDTMVDPSQAHQNARCDVRQRRMRSESGSKNNT
jgi:hypothetical protein